MSNETNLTRRHLLAAAGTVPVALSATRAFAQAASGQPMPTDAAPQPALPGEQMRWAVVGLGVFLVSWLWALGTSLSILHSADGSEKSNAPPRFY